MPGRPAPAAAAATSTTPPTTWRTRPGGHQPARWHAPHQGAADLAHDHDADGVHREREAERLGRQAVEVLEHERRARDVREHRRERERRRERVAHERPVGQQQPERAAQLAQAAGAAALERQRLAAGEAAPPRTAAAPMAASTTNTPRHEVASSSWPPMIGARMGARPLTSIVSAKKRASAVPVCRSRTTARAMTMPGRARQPLDAPEGDELPRHRTRPRTAGTPGCRSAGPASNGRRRPSRSLSGPAISCPRASPMRHAVSVSPMTAARACRGPWPAAAAPAGTCRWTAARTPRAPR